VTSEVAFEHVVYAIQIEDGDQVHAGDALIELDPTGAEADRARLAHDLLQAQLDRARLRGLREALRQGSVPALFDPPGNATEAQLEATAAAMRAQHAEHAQKLASIDQQIVQKRTEGEEAKASLAKLRASLPLVAQEAEVRRQVMEMQWGNKIAWLQAQQRLVEQQHELAVIEHKREEADAARAALERQREQIRAEYEKTVLTDLAKAEQQASQSGQELIKASQKAQLQTLRAPIDGTVQQLVVHTLGGVVTPAQPVLVVVPDQVGLVVEVRVENKDIGFVHAGQDAEVKVESFNFTRYGLIHGTVRGISRDAVTEDQKAPPTGKPGDGKGDDARSQQGSGSPGYTARIALDRTAIDTENGAVDLGPGMAITAEIKTGRRRVINYLLSPLVRYRQEGLRER
jgi:hemolysin D